MRPISVSLCVTLILLTSSCRQSADREFVEHVFRGFVYIESEPFREFLTRKDDAVGDAREDLRNGIPIPDVLVPGQQSVFVCPKHCPVRELATDVLPSRLKQAGARNVKHAKDGSQLLDVFVGGPVFFISFEWQNRRFQLRNTPNLKVVLQFLADGQ